LVKLPPRPERIGNLVNLEFFKAGLKNFPISPLKGLGNQQNPIRRVALLVKLLINSGFLNSKFGFLKGQLPLI